MYSATTYYPHNKYHDHHVGYDQYTRIRCTKKHKKPVPLSHQLIPYLTIYIAGFISALILINQ